MRLSTSLQAFLASKPAKPQVLHAALDVQIGLCLFAPHLRLDLFANDTDKYL